MAARGNEVEIVVRTKDQATGPSRRIVHDMATHGDKAGRGFSKRLHTGISAGFGPIRGMVRGFGSALVPLIAGAGLLAGGKAMRDLGIRITDLDKKADAVFGGQLPVVRRWAEANKRAFGLTRRETVALAANFADLLKPMGFTAREATSMSTRVLDLSGALSKWTGGQRSAAEVSEILSSAMLGEREQLKGLGIAISEADVQARLAAKGQDELTGAAREQAEAIATMELILAKSTDAQKAWADGGRAAAESQRGLGVTVGELKEMLATGLRPVIASIVGWLGTTLPDALANAAQWWDENKDAVKGLAEVLRSTFVPAAKDTRGQVDGLAASGIKLKDVLSFLTEAFLRAMLVWLRAETFIGGLIRGIALLIMGGGQAINVMHRMAGGAGTAGDAMVAFGRDLDKSARRQLREIQGDAIRAQRAIDAMHGKTLRFTSVWTTIGQAGMSMHQVVGQHGGIVRRPTMALLGEAGPEAVVPLDRAPGNSPLPGGRMGGGPIHLHISIGGREVGEAVIDPLRGAIRKRGGDVQVVLGT
jgi:hypothetical protein